MEGMVCWRGVNTAWTRTSGGPPPRWGKGGAEVLQQLPADSIDKIEVITNPSAKYKPDGTAGIINIALKQKHDGGISSTILMMPAVPSGDPKSTRLNSSHQNISYAHVCLKKKN